MSFANKLREIAHNSVDQEKAKKIVKILLEKAEYESKNGKFEVFCTVLNSDVGLKDSYYSTTYFDWDKYSNTTALALLVKKELEINGLKIVERHGVNGMYGVIVW